MTIFEVVKNALLAGFGVQEKVNEFIAELVKKGELSESQGAKLVKEWTDKADRNAEQLGTNISEIISKTVEKMTLATKGDIEALNTKVQALALRVKKLEGIREEGSEEE